MAQDGARFDLGGRVALVTGAGQGVGRAIALCLAEHGAAVAVNDIVPAHAEAVAAEIRETGGTALPMIADVTDRAAFAGAAASIAEALGPVEILVNNAGNAGAEGFPSDLPLFWETDPARWRKFAEVNLFGVMNCCHAILPGMVRLGRGRVVTIVSDSARTIEGRMADYAAAKAGAAGFMRALAADAARFGVTANCVAIGSIRGTGVAPAPEAGHVPSEAEKRALARYALRRYGVPEDIAGTVLLLCSDASAWVTGQTWPVNGGYSASL